MQTLRIDPGFRSFLPALSPEERKFLERNLSTDGCREPLVVWESEEHDEPTILDGHNRYEICTLRGIEFETVEVEDCPDREAAIAWIVANQLGRRNLTPSQKAALALELEKQLAEAAKLRRRATQNNNAGRAVVEKFPPQEQGKARDKAAEMIGANPHYVTDAKKIERDAPEILDQIKQGKLSIPQAKKVAALPVEQRPAEIERIQRKESEEGGYIFRDGKLVAVQTRKEAVAWAHRNSQVLDAIEALATMDVSPEQYLQEFSPDSAEEIDTHLSAAVRWITHFVKLWEQRNAQAA